MTATLTGYVHIYGNNQLIQGLQTRGPSLTFLLAMADKFSRLIFPQNFVICTTLRPHLSLKKGRIYRAIQ